MLDAFPQHLEALRPTRILWEISQGWLHTAPHTHIHTHTNSNVRLIGKKTPPHCMSLLKLLLVQSGAAMAAFAHSSSSLSLWAVSEVNHQQAAFAVLNIKEKLHNMKQNVELKRKVTVHHRVGQVFRLVDGRGPVRSVSWTASHTINRLTSPTYVFCALSWRS